MATKLSEAEQDVQLVKEALTPYPQWDNEREVIARGLVSRGIGSIERVKGQYEKIIAAKDEEIYEKSERIAELTALNAEYARVLTAIRELTCSEIGIKIDEPVPSKKTNKE